MSELRNFCFAKTLEFIINKTHLVSNKLIRRVIGPSNTQDLVIQVLHAQSLRFMFFKHNLS